MGLGSGFGSVCGSGFEGRGSPTGSGMTSGVGPLGMAISRGVARCFDSGWAQGEPGDRSSGLVPDRSSGELMQPSGQPLITIFTRISSVAIHPAHLPQSKRRHDAFNSKAVTPPGMAWWRMAALHYSCRRASMGFSLEALRAGRYPKTTPTEAENRKEMTTMSGTKLKGRCMNRAEM